MSWDPFDDDGEETVKTSSAIPQTDTTVAGTGNVGDVRPAGQDASRRFCWKCAVVALVVLVVGVALIRYRKRVLP